MRSAILDCTELYQNPVRTGVQRVVRELLRAWPSNGPELHVARFEHGQGLVGVPDAAVALMSDRTEAARSLPHAELSSAIVAASQAQGMPSLPKAAVRFLPEVFYDPARCLYYQDQIANRKSTVALLAYDFLPFLAPEQVGMRTAVPAMNYLRLVQSVSYIAHISERTRREYIQRVMRGQALSEGITLPLGADGLPLERQQWDAGRRTFVALGSLDGWKNQEVIMAAFLRLWAAGHDIPLTLIGSPYEGIDLSWLEPAKGYPQFRWLSQASDEEVANQLRKARATIYIPEFAGFGLPPIESLHAGIPVITLASMPSLEALPSDGQIRLQRADAELLADAVLSLSEDEAATTAWRGAAHMRLATWRDFAVATAAWLENA